MSLAPTKRSHESDKEDNSDRPRKAQHVYSTNPRTMKERKRQAKRSDRQTQWEKERKSEGMALSRAKKGEDYLRASAEQQAQMVAALVAKREQKRCVLQTVVVFVVVLTYS